MSKNLFQVTKVPKILAKHIITKDYLKIAVWTRHVCIWHSFTKNTKHYFQLAYLKWWSYKNDSFAFVSGRYTIKFTEHLGNLIQNELWHIKLYMNTGISNWHMYEVSTLQKWSICLYFSSIHNYSSPNTWNYLLRNYWSEIERCEKRAFQLLKMRKMNFSWNINAKYVTIFFLLSVRSSCMKDYTCR